MQFTNRAAKGCARHAFGCAEGRNVFKLWLGLKTVHPTEFSLAQLPGSFAPQWNNSLCCAARGSALKKQLISRQCVCIFGRTRPSSSCDLRKQEWQRRSEIGRVVNGHRFRTGTFTLTTRHLTLHILATPTATFILPVRVLCHSFFLRLPRTFAIRAKIGNVR